MITKITARREEMQRARIIKGWNYSKLGREAGVTGQTVGRIERGENVSPGTAKKIADALGRPVAELFAIS
jgi:transcriptional regulator with XRE-family HTH domain